MKSLKELRKKHNLNQKKMAERLDISSSHYVKLENGFVNPGFKVLKRIKEEFNEVDMNDFFK
ncbi:helix-turn-helix domain-containing protein [Enterococcus hirae]